MTTSSTSKLRLFNAHIITMNPQQPYVESLDISDGRILALQNNIHRRSRNNAEVEKIDLDGRIVLPGLCDAHIHLDKYAQMLDQVDCETETLDECLRRVEARCKTTPPDQWVLGHGWNQNSWKRYGALEELDSISPKNPVYLTAKSLHAGWANSKALEVCGLTETSQDPPKGKLQRDEAGQLTGILFEDALRMISERIPRPDNVELTAMIGRAQNTLNAWGITSVHDFDGLGCLAALRALEQQGSLKLRVLKHIRYKDFNQALQNDLRSDYTGNWIRIGHLKLFADGALGPRTAAMLEGYQGEPENFGMLQLDLEELTAIGRAAIQSGYPLAIHAIGDQANRTALQAIESLQASNLSTPLPYPHRIEHLQLLHPDDLYRPAQLGITVSMQPIHAISDHEMADRYWGGRARYSYAWNSQFKSGATVIFGSDAPVESPNPWLGIYAAVTRKPLDKSGKETWIEQERITLMDALRAYTILPAQASSWDDSIGLIAVGVCADLIILDRDPFGQEPEDLSEIKPCGVMVNGKWVIRDF